MFDITQEEDYRELTLEEQYLVNGGKEIENSIAAQADASVGDTVTDSNGKTSTLTQGDINWAQKVMAERNGSGGNSGADSGSPSYGPSGPNSSSPSKTKSPQQQTTGSSRGSKTGYSIDDENKIISADINDPEGIMEAYSRYYMLSDRGYAFELKDRNKHVHTFSDMKYVENYVKSIDKSESHFSEVMDNLSTTSGLANDIMRRTVLNADKISEMTGISINTAKLSISSKLASNISKFTGAIGLWLNIKKFKNEPTFKNGIKILAGGVSFANTWGGLGVSVGGEAINTTANACLDVWHPILRREQIINGFNDSYNNSQVLGFGVSDIDAKSAFYNCCRFFFGD